MKFSSLLLGTRATKRVELPIGDARHPLLVRPLTGSEIADVLQRARDFAKARGSTEPKEGDRLYDLGYMVATLVIACADVDNPAAPFFDQGEAQILAALDTDRITLLYEEQQAFQDECAPRPKEMSANQYMQLVLECAAKEADAESPFEKLAPGLRRNFVHTLARQHVILLRDRLQPGSPSLMDGSDVTAHPSPKPDAAPPAADA